VTPPRRDESERSDLGARQSPWIQGHDPSAEPMDKSAHAAWGALCSGAPILAYPSGVEIYRQGNAPSEVFAIVHGFAKLVKTQADGREVVIALCCPGQLLGAGAAILDSPHEVSAVAISRCQLRRFRTEDFLHLAHANDQVSWEIHRLQSQYLAEQADQLAGWGSLTAGQRLEQFLEHMTRILPVIPSSEGLRMRLPLRYGEVAQLIHVTAPYLSRLLDELEQSGVLKRKARWLILPHHG
jgi:CRP/FNR family cyclic AMP-dependent transcriptional regulator